MPFGRFGNTVCIALLVTAVIVVYARGLSNGFIYDDYWLVQSNPALQQPGSLRQFLTTPLFAGSLKSEDSFWAGGGFEYWRPFAKLALLAQYRVFGARASGYHAVSLLVHTASVLMAFAWLLRRLAMPAAGHRAAVAAVPRLIATSADPRRTLAAGLGAALFGLHPARVESVTWISGCMDLWMVFWVLVGLLVWEHRGRAATLGACAAFVLAALSKETALVVPGCLALDAWARLHLHRSGLRRVVVPTVCLALVALAWLALVPPSTGGVGFGGVSRVLVSIALYAGRVFWPWHPSMQVGLAGPDGRFALGPARVLAGAVIVVLVAAIAVMAVRRAAWRAWLADLGWVVLPLVPVLNIVAIGYTTLVAERFLALPLLGIAALSARAIVRVPRVAAPVVAGAEVAAAVAAAAIAASYVPHLRDDATLWRHEAQLAPSHPHVLLQLARAEAGAGQLDAAQRAALTAYDSAVTPDLRAWAALAWAGARLRQVGDADQAELVRLREFYDALAERSRADLNAGGRMLQVAPSRVVLDLMRQSSGVRNARVLAHARTGSLDTAEALWRDLVRESPTPAGAANWIRVLAVQLRFSAARDALTAARRAWPQDATLSSLAEPIASAERWMGGEDASDPLRRDTTRALLWLYFGSVPLARAALAPAQAAYPDAVETAVMAQLVQAAAGQVHAAREFFLRARLTDVVHASTYEWGLGQIPRVGGQARDTPADAPQAESAPTAAPPSR